MDSSHESAAPPKKIKLWIFYGVAGFLFLFFAAVLALPSLLKLYKVPQNGMYPALAAGDYLLVRKRPYKNPSQIRRGDVVVYEEMREGQLYYFVWRVIGLPGDTVSFRDDAVVLNGLKLPREKVGSREGLEIEREKLGDVSYEIAVDPHPSASIPAGPAAQVPPDRFFVMGDNRHHAFDSRFTGPIPFSSIIGKRL